jgi:menaquinol-cytochrome c reductase iron-sulfur subunit
MIFRNQAKEASSDQSRQITRRDITVRSIYGLTSLIGLALSAPVTMYLFARPKSGGDTGWVDAGSIDKFPVGVPQSAPVLRVRIDGWKLRTEKDTVWVIKQSDGSVKAFSPVCTHLGCAYHWDQTKSHFVCPCHGSEFALSGEVLAGPAPRPLDQFVTKLEGDRLWLGQLEQSGESKRHA